MSIKTITLIAITASFTLCAQAQRKIKTIHEDFALEGADGIIKIDDANDKIFFQFQRDITDGRATIKKQTNVEFLPSSTLQKILENAQKRTEKQYRIWGKLTEYQGKNFIFPIYFLPVTSVPQEPKPKPKSEPNDFTSQRPQLETPKEPNKPNDKKNQKPTMNDPNDPLMVPKDILTRFKPRKVITTEELTQAQIIKENSKDTSGIKKEIRRDLKIKEDSILANRTGFITETNKNKYQFTIDGLGRNVGKLSFDLLASKELQRAIEKRQNQAEYKRLKVSGILTRYKNKTYLLIQRARRTYSHGNFGR